MLMMLMKLGLCIIVSSVLIMLLICAVFAIAVAIDCCKDAYNKRKLNK